MYFPFPILEWIQDPQYRPRPRPVTPDDVGYARILARMALDRLHGDEREMLRQHLRQLLAGALVPVLGHLLLGWPLELIGLAAAVDALALAAADRIRSSRAYSAVRAALFHAAHVEIAVQIAAELRSGTDSAAKLKQWRAHPDWHMSRAVLLLIVPAGLLATLLPGPVASGDWFMFASVVAVPIGLRLHEALRDARHATLDRVPDTHFLPHSPAALILLALAGGIGVGLWYVLELVPGGEAWRGYGVLAIWVACTMETARRWLRRMRQGAHELQALLDADPRILRYRLRASFDPQSFGQREFFEHATRPGSLWPPIWIELPEDEKALWSPAQRTPGS